MKKVILNLGRGKIKIPGSIGIDLVKIENYVDNVQDLDILQYPFNDNIVDEIHCYHVQKFCKSSIN